MTQGKAIVPFKPRTPKKRGRRDDETLFDYYRERIYKVPLFSRIAVQCIETSAYPEQIKVLERFISDWRDALFQAQTEKVGKSVEQVEKIDARLLSEVSHMVREMNVELNEIHGLADRFPILVQNRNTPLKR